MKQNELRLGNYIDFSGDIEIINGIYIDIEGAVEKYEYLISTENLEGELIELFNPIIITEEILTKFGFENWGTVIVNEFETYERWVLYNAVDGTSNYEVHIITSNYDPKTLDLITEIAYYVDNDLQVIYETYYVHNLQNAFYLATGKELTI
jgi:hypothetical protein